MTPLFRQLQRLEASGTPIRVGVIGVGAMGRGLVHQLAQMPGLVPALVVARNVGRAVAAYRDAGFADADIVVTNDAVPFAAALG